MALIEIKQVSKAFPGVGRKAVDNLSLQIEKGQIVTLLGPSGCGKTTILRLLAGFEQPDTGTITLTGRCVAGNGCRVPPEQRGIGMVFQDYALFPHLTVARNIAFPIADRKGADRAERVEQMLRLTGLEGFANRYPHELSGGQQQRVALARALCPEPVVVLLDEPFSNLDAGLKERMRQEVSEIIKKTATTAVFVSHDQKDALAVSDQIVVLYAGALIQQGTPREIYQHPATSFVAGFVGKSNILTGTVTDTNIIETLAGPVPCFHQHGARPGTKVLLSVRPDSFELSKNGRVRGRLVKAVFVGHAIEAVISVEGLDGTRVELQVHIHPEKDVRVGDILQFKVLPDFVAVVD